jgi:hypothetical protein
MKSCEMAEVDSWSLPEPMKCDARIDLARVFLIWCPEVGSMLLPFGAFL